MKKIVILSIVFIQSICVNAQFRLDMFSSSEQQLVQSVVSNSLLIIEQSYQLRDTVSNQLFGRNNRPEFGKIRGIGVKSTAGYILGKQLMTPWMLDANCTRYLNEYKGVLSKTTAFELTDTVSPAHELPISIMASQNTKVCCVNDTTVFHGKGFETRRNHDINGWMIWITSRSGLNDLKEGDRINYIIYKKEFELTPDSVLYKVTPPTTDETILGGIYITQAIPQIGMMQFYLDGFLYNEANEWNMVLTNFEETLNVQNAQVQHDNITLTPVDDSGTNSKKTKKTKKSKK